MFRHVLVATNGSKLSLIAMRDGIELARACHARVTFVTCSKPHEAGMELEAAARTQPGMDRADAAGVHAARLHVVADQPWQGLLDTAQRERCDLIVLASRGHRPISGLLLGSQTLKLLTQSNHAVLVCAPREGEFAIRHVLAPSDGSPPSHEAMRTAVDIAAAAGARVTLLTCTAPVVEHAGAGDRARYEEVASSIAIQRLAQGALRAHERRVPAALEHVQSNHPHRAILDYARQSGCDLIVMASQGRRSAISLVLASETLKVLTEATVPVLVLR